MSAQDLAARRAAVRGRPDLNGLDYLEVGADPRRLDVRFVNPLGDAALAPHNLRVDGGERIRGLRVLAARRDPDDPRRLLVEVDRAGDFSPYLLRLVTAADNDEPPPGVDPCLAALPIAFRVASDALGGAFHDDPGGGDEPPVDDAPPPRAPPIDYLARDYEAVRRHLLARLAAQVPDLDLTSPVDLGVTLVELLAHAADQLAYRQDAIAGEAYLATARRRVSLRRLARLVDYSVHEGCNARAWVALEVAAPLRLAAQVPLLTHVPGLPAALRGADADLALDAAEAVFETMSEVTLLPEHNAIALYTWGDADAALRRGAVRATLAGDLPGLRIGAPLLLEAIRGPDGDPLDADPRLRHVVRIRTIRPRQDPLTRAAITEVSWDARDALPFELPLAAAGLPPLALARANLVLADHGRTRAGEPLGVVPAPHLRRAGPAGEDLLLPPRFTPRLAARPLTHAAPVDPRAPAADALLADPRRAAPSIELIDDQGARWRARRDLLGAGPDERAFVVEIEDDGEVALRFGDDEGGRRPRVGAALHATYRVGNGAAGNLGEGALRHIVHPDPAILRVRNPLPAVGGVDPEAPGSIRQRAPVAFRRQARAITEGDYRALAEAHAEVQRAAATLRWTGSGYTSVVRFDRLGGGPLGPSLQGELHRHLAPFARIGHDLAIREPIHVPLELDLRVTVDPGHPRAAVREAILTALAGRPREAGRRGFFHPDRFTFGQPVIVSRIVAAVHAIPGVASVEITRLQRLGRPDRRVLAEGVLRVGADEVVRLDHDPNFAERGLIRLDLGGGR